MNQIMISIVVPVYNVEKYINQCIDSILSQTYPHFELICVDDGSTDRSYEILKEYEKQDSRIIVIQQENQYAGVARNRGMNIAQGKYILFLDSDDFFCEDMLEKLCKKAEEVQSEVLVFDAFQYDNPSKEVITTTWKALQKMELEDGVKSAKELKDIIFDFTVPAPWNKLFLRDFIKQNNLRFQSIKRTNDLYFVYAALSMANRISILNEKLVYYRDNNSTSLQGKGEQTPDIFVEALMGLKEHLLDKKIWEDFKKSYESMALSIAFYNLNNMKTKDNYLLLYHALKHNLFPQLVKEDKLIDSPLLEEIEFKREIIIYGAGAVAKSVISFLLYKCNYEKEKISIVVSNANQDMESIYGINIRAFDQVEKSKQDNLVVIAINGEHVQQEIMKKVKSSGFMQVTKMGYKEIAAIIRNWK